MQGNMAPMTQKTLKYWYIDPEPNMRDGPMTPQTIDELKKARPLGQENLAGCSLSTTWLVREIIRYKRPGKGSLDSTYRSQTPSIFPSVQFITAICTKEAQMVATTWHQKVILGGIFM